MTTVDRKTVAVVPAHVVRRFEADHAAPGLARRHVAAILEAWELADLIETAVLLVSELVTNACRASTGRAAVIATRVTRTNTDLIIEVWDADPSAPVRRDPALDVEGGRGLLLVAALSSRWAFYRPATGGKVVWCSLALPVLPAAATSSASELPRRRAPAGPPAPIEIFDDPAVLQRVADGLRALDWHLPPGDPLRS
ncbi:ATP-binding protein [Frankia sp. BMG5.23]|uniref:ATP-binding protein n=1 Tax=Frankia sp. BMG5.23 TaxID=683305 RepID=UPI0009F9650F|nr:ATP-binding protein [Frankia sp. BMG5.23]